MATRPRISITLHEPWQVYLGWLAAERGELPAELARGMLETALERTRADPDVRRAYEEWVGRGGDDPDIQADVVAALQTDGVPFVLRGDLKAASREALCAARYLSLISVWLMDDRPRAEKEPPPRLADILSTAIPRFDVSPALAYAGDADGATKRGAARGGRMSASDKRQLSDIGGDAPGGVSNEWT